MTIEELIDLQEAGSRARILGLKLTENPYLKPERRPTEDTVAIDNWAARHDAWKFGWEAEHASREGGISNFFRNLIQYRNRTLLP